jgi:hypothetical protein
MRSIKSRQLAALTSAVTFGVLLVAPLAAPAAAGPYCGITWGSLMKSDAVLTPAPIVGARVGQQDCYDRLVIDLGGKLAAGYRAYYVDRFGAVGTGDQLTVAGGATLKIEALAPTYDVAGRPTVPWKVGTHIVTAGQFSAAGFRTFRDLVFGGSFEGESAFGLGVRARLPFRVFKLDGPDSGSRLVIDVAHQW